MIGKLPRARAAGAAFAVLTLLLAGCGRSPDTPRAVGQLAWDRLELTAEAAEPIRAIAVAEGDQVAAGALLVRLDSERAEARLAGAEAERGRLAAALAELRRGPRAERIAEAEARLKGARAALALAQREMRRQQDLARQQLTSPEAVDRAETEWEQAKAEREAAAARLAELQHGALPEEMAQAEQALAAAVAVQREARIARERLLVTAPRPGRVDALPYEVGERPPQGAVLAVLLVGAGPYARIYLPEPLRVAIAPGTPALVHVDGLREPLPGRVRRVGSDPVFTPYFALTEHDRRYLNYLAEVTLEGAEALPAGVPLEVAFPTLAREER